ncbi:MAG: hypothetical protein IJ567_01280 [Lachnospiraceae bacterium]|nr:hypothetical protein [Lachnospiraceae bacterium]
MIKVGKVLVFLTTAMVLLCGCSSTELEERNFPLAAAVTWEETGGYQMALGFQRVSDVADQKTEKENRANIAAAGTNSYELFEEADAKNPGKMDYNHIKALVIGQELLFHSEQLADFLDFVEQQNVIARSTLLFTCKATPEELMACGENLEDNVGNYLKDLITSSQDHKSDAAVTLGDLLKAYHNQDEMLMIPELGLDSGQPVIAGYEVLCGFTPAGYLTSEQGEQLLLSCGELLRYGIAMEDGSLIQLSGIHCQYEIRGNGAQVDETVWISGNIKRFAGEIPENMEELFADELTKQAQEQLREQGIDLTNSYYKLGGYDRTAYARYASDYPAYLANLRIQYVCRFHEI